VGFFVKFSMDFLILRRFGEQMLMIHMDENCYYPKKSLTEVELKSYNRPYKERVEEDLSVFGGI
jgi:hypothetical protein